VFRDLGCKFVVLLNCAPHIVMARLLERGDESWNASEVASFAKSEADHAALVCSSLTIPMITVESPTPDEFEAIIAERLGAR